MRIGKFLYFGDFAVIPIAVLWLGAAAYLAGGAVATRMVREPGVRRGPMDARRILVHRYAYHHAPV